MSNDSGHNEHLNLKNVIKIVFVLVVIAILSLTSSYIFFSSEYWKQVYTPNGWLTELYRIWILIGVSIYLFIGPFEYEFIEIKSFKKKYKPLPLCRNIALALATISLIVLLGYHLDIGPKFFATGPKYLFSICDKTKEELKELQLDAPEEILKLCDKENIVPKTPKYWQSFKRPYIYYLPYSILTFIIIGITLFITTMYSSIKSFKKLNLLINNLDKQIRLNYTFVEDNCSELNVVCNSQILLKKCKDISYENITYFENFCLDFMEIIHKYAALFFSASVVLSFEYFVGKYTLAQPAKIWTFLSIGLFFILVAIIFSGYLYYERAFNKNVKVLHNITKYLDIANRESLYEKFKNNYSVLNFCQRVFRQHLGLWIAMVLLTSINIVNPVIEAATEVLK